MPLPPGMRPGDSSSWKTKRATLAALLHLRGAQRCTMPRILLVDDDPAWRKLYRMAFEGQFDLFEATDGYQALSVLGAVRPDVIVLDLRMPRMDGMDFIRRLSRRRPPPQGDHLRGQVDRGGAPADPRGVPGRQDAGPQGAVVGVAEHDPYRGRGR